MPSISLLFPIVALLHSAVCALPYGNPPNSTAVPPVNTTIAYYVGTADSSQGPSTQVCSMYQVAQNNLTANTCTNPTVNGISIAQDPTWHCTLTMWSGVTDCSGSSNQTFAIPPGNGTECFSTGVYDSEWQHASAMWSCQSQ